MAAVAKIAGSWGAVSAADSINSVDWSQIASIAATILTILLILHFLWKNVLRPIAIWRGWIKRPRRRIILSSETDHGDIE